MTVSKVACGISFFLDSTSRLAETDLIQTSFVT